MSDWLDELRVRQDVVTIPRVWLTIALSILIHIAVLFIWIPRTQLLTEGNELQDLASDRLQVVLETPPTPTPTPTLPSAAIVPPPVQAPRAPAPSRPPRAIVRLEQPRLVAPPTPQTPAIPPPPPVAAPPRPAPPVEGDLAAYIAARKRERGEREAAPDNDTAQFNRNIAANMPTPARGVAAQDTKHGGGIFQIRRMTYDDAAYEFFGWNTTMGRKTPQLIEVRKGNNPDMQIAVVRSMIGIVRQFEKEDFTWESQRVGRTVTLSARMSDNAALEAFLMREFFENGRGAQ